MGQLKQWRDQQWVRIGADGGIKGPCGKIGRASCRERV